MIPFARCPLPRFAFALFTIAATAAFPAGARAEPVETALARCRSIADAEQRLACYDDAARALDARPAAEGTPVTSDDDRHIVPVVPISLGEPVAGDAQNSAQDAATSAAAAAPVTSPEFSLSPLSRQWDLDRKNAGGVFTLRPYRANYLLPIAYNFSLNPHPSTPEQGTATLYGDDLKHTEAQFQISLKTKLWDEILGSPLSLWFGYTQKSYWQLYNRRWSSPFRETDYEPELIATLPVSARLFGVRLRMLGAGLVHQSNGQSAPLSRSWNRAYAMAGLEYGDVSVLARGWYRIPENAGSDDNPDITKYMGYGDLYVHYQWNDFTFGLLGRLNAATGYGAAQLDVTFPLHGYLRGYVRYFDGYGENLLDYNHHNRALGIGFVLSDWKTR